MLQEQISVKKLGTLNLLISKFYPSSHRLKLVNKQTKNKLIQKFKSFDIRTQIKYPHIPYFLIFIMSRNQDSHFCYSKNSLLKIKIITPLKKLPSSMSRVFSQFFFIKIVTAELFCLIEPNRNWLIYQGKLKLITKFHIKNVIL